MLELDERNSTHPHRGDLVRYVEGRLSSSEDESINGHLAECKLCQSHLSEAAASKIAGNGAQATSERRQSRRIGVSDKAILRVLNPFDSTLKDVDILDVSKNGLKLLMNINLPVGATIQLKLRDLWILGEVRHCSEHGSFYSAGIEIHDVSGTGSQSLENPLLTP